jgi:outer membrane protein TolC
MRGTLHCLRLPTCLFALLVLLAAQALGEPLTFRRAVELAIARASTEDLSVSDQARAQAAYDEARSAYLPHVTAGSGLGWTYGYPLTLEGGAPSIVNLNYQSTVFSLQQRALTRAARETLGAQKWTTEDARRDVALEATITYIQMNSLNARRKLLEEQLQTASQMVQITGARVKEGVEAQVELTRARLAEAQTRMAIADADGGSSVLRLRLAQLTGLAPSSIQLVPESIPAIPQPDPNEDLVGQALANSAAVRAAQQQLQAQQSRAEAAHKARYPSVDLAAQYGVFSRFNNYDQFFSKFQRNNATIGLAIRFPFLDSTLQASAEAADAEAVKAKQQLEQVRNQVSTQTLQLAQAAERLAIAEQVAQLEYQLAQSNVDATQQRIQTQAPPAPGARPPSPRDLELAQIEASQRDVSTVDVSFELQRARLQLLRATGKLQDWVLGK